MTKHQFPGFDHLYMLHDPLSHRRFRGSIGLSHDTLSITRGEIDPSDPIRVGWGMGGKIPSDVIWTQNAHPLIVHARVIAILQDQGLSGWRTYPVQVVTKAGEQCEGYFGLAIIGRCGPMDLARSELALRESLGGWHPYFHGHFFSEGSWDGTDLFMATADNHGKVTRHMYATESVVDAIRRAKVRNIEFECLADAWVSAAVYEIGSRYRLPQDYAQRVDKAYARAGVSRPG